MNDATQDHVIHRYDEELKKLEKRVVDMSALVREQLTRIPLAISETDEDVVKTLIESDRPIDVLELKADKLIVSMIARRAPMGSDLRFIIAVSRIVTELERLGDEATYVAKALLNDKQHHQTLDQAKSFEEIGELSNLAIASFDAAIAAFVRSKSGKAKALLNSEAAVGGELSQRLQVVIEKSKQQDDVNHAVNLVLATRSIDSIIGYVRNIAEHVIYLSTGKDIRHK